MLGRSAVPPSWRQSSKRQKHRGQGASETALTIVTGAVGLGAVGPIHAIGYVGNNIGSAVGVFGAAFL